MNDIDCNFFTFVVSNLNVSKKHYSVLASIFDQIKLGNVIQCALLARYDCMQQQLTIIMSARHLAFHLRIENKQRVT